MPLVLAIFHSLNLSINKNNNFKTNLLANDSKIVSIFKFKKIRFKGTSSFLDFRISYIALKPFAVPDESELKITLNSCAPNVEIIGPGNIIQQCFAKINIQKLIYN